MVVHFTPPPLFWAPPPRLSSEITHPGTPRMVKLSLKGATFLLFATLFGLTGCLAIMSVGMPCLLVALALRRRGFDSLSIRFLRAHHFVSDCVAYYWFGMISLLLSRVMGTKTVGVIEDSSNTSTTTNTTNAGNRRGGGVPRRRVLTSPQQWDDALTAPADGRVLIVMSNHRTRIDWLLLWPFFLRANEGRLLWRLKIALKSSLRNIPIFGWAMQHFRFLFLSRDRKMDEKIITETANHWTLSNDGPTFLIFPEGSDLSETNIAKSQAFAKEHGKPLFHHVLNPRTTGLLALRDAIGDDRRISGVVDLTMGYRESTPGTRTSEASILSGNMPRQVRVLIRKYSVEDVFGKRNVATASSSASSSSPPSPSDQSQQHFISFMENLYRQKEVDLTEFYQNNPHVFAGEEDATMTADELTTLKGNSSEGASVGYGREILAFVVCCAGFYATVACGMWLLWLPVTVVAGLIGTSKGGIDRWLVMPFFSADERRRATTAESSPMNKNSNKLHKGCD